jgi:GNAT superfamily N-acetyltransferase
MPVEITPARSHADLKQFIELPFRLHAGTKWIPPLKLERYAFLSRKLNPFFKHGDAAYFLARRDGRVVGRITAQYDRNFNAFHDNRWGFFGFLEFEDDQEIVDALLVAAEAWLKQQGRDRMVGPFDFAINDECGVLIEGFEYDPMIRQPWHPPYYQARVEAAAGMLKAMDVFHWHLNMADRETKLLPILEELAVTSHEKHGITITKMSWWRLGRDLKEFLKIYNAAWSKNWGFQPYDDHDLADMAINYRLIFDKHFFMLAKNPEGETVAAAITIPDINQVFKKMKGTLLPFGWWHYLRRKKTIDRARVGFLGVLPEYQHTGVAAQLYIENYDMCKITPIKSGEPGWILETNTSMNRGSEAMGGHVIKRARIYERLLEEGATPSAPPEKIRRYTPKAPAEAEAPAENG